MFLVNNLKASLLMRRCCFPSSTLLKISSSYSTSTGLLQPLSTLSEEEEAIKDSIKHFTKERILPLVARMDEREVLDPDLLRDLFNQGLMGLDISPTYGGSGASYTSLLLAVEEVSKACPAVATTFDVHSLVGALLNLYGTDKQKETYLTPHTSHKLGSFCLSEAGSGSDAFALKTTATLEEGGEAYFINGSKMWITNSFEAETFLVFATVDPKLGYKGITCFIVAKVKSLLTLPHTNHPPSTLPWAMGIQIMKKEKKLGIRASSTCQLNFDNVRVPASNVLGKVGEGYKYAIRILNEGRIGIAAQMCGLAQGALDASLPYTYQRKQFGKEVGSFQGMQFQMAQMETEIQAARLLTYNAARMKEASDRGEKVNFVMEAAMAKLYAAQTAKKASALAIEWCGGVGFTRDLPVEKFYRDAMVGQIYEGTSNIQLMTIAKCLKPKYDV